VATPRPTPRSPGTPRCLWVARAVRFQLCKLGSEGKPCRGKRCSGRAGGRGPTPAARPQHWCPSPLQKPPDPPLAFPTELPVGTSLCVHPRRPRAADGSCSPCRGRGSRALGCGDMRVPVPDGTSSACLAAPVPLHYPALKSRLGAQLQLLHKTQAREA